MLREHYVELGCSQCLEGAGLDFDFSFAFQPIVDSRTRSVFSHEALVRGPAGEPAGSVLGRLVDSNRYRFDQACRVKIIQLAATLKLDTFLNINFYPNAVYKPELCIRTTLQAALTYSFPIERIMFEVTEEEKIRDQSHLLNIFETYQRLGFLTAIDDFGAGYAGLNLLSAFQPNFIKLDMALVRDVHKRKSSQVIIKGMTGVCRDLDIELIAEGVESRDEYHWLASAGIHRFQGFYFSRPEFESLPVVPSNLFD